VTSAELSRSAGEAATLAGEGAVPGLAMAHGTAGPRRPGRRAGRRKTTVLEAACRVIASRGAEATRFTDVAEASGVPVSTLQYYFGSREDLLVAAFRHASANELAALAADAAAAESPWERIVVVVRRALAGYLPGDADAGLLWIESWHFAIRDAEMRGDALRDYAGWRELVADAVLLGTAAGDFSPVVSAEQVAVLAIAMVDGAGVPLALGDPGLTVASATADVLTSVAAILRFEIPRS
jgi:AcrR family transcriptional regulator